jgi:hypothetical protein
MDIRNHIPANLFHTGNAILDSVSGTGWFIGQFVPLTNGLRHQTNVELKWGIHKRGERRPGGFTARVTTTISILIEGALLTTLRIGDTSHDIMMKRPGDYLIFGPSVSHQWEALADSIVLSVRCPSIPQDSDKFIGTSSDPKGK